MLSVGLWLSGLGLLQSHGLSLMGMQDQETHGAWNEDHGHEHAQEEAPPIIRAALHVHGPDSASQGHNPLDHSHETPSLPLLIAEVKPEIRHCFVVLPQRHFSDCDPRPLERPPMKALAI